MDVQELSDEEFARRGAGSYARARGHAVHSTSSLRAALGAMRPSAFRGRWEHRDQVLLGRNEIFEERVLPNIDDPVAKARHVVVIDIETGKYEVSEGPIRARDATQRLLERCPEAKGRIWTRRVGSPVAHRLGGRVLPDGTQTP